MLVIICDTAINENKINDEITKYMQISKENNIKFIDNQKKIFVKEKDWLSKFQIFKKTFEFIGFMNKDTLFMLKDLFYSMYKINKVNHDNIDAIEMIISNYMKHFQIENIDDFIDNIVVFINKNQKTNITAFFEIMRYLHESILVKHLDNTSIDKLYDALLNMFINNNLISEIQCGNFQKCIEYTKRTKSNPTLLRLKNALLYAIFH